MSTPSQAQPRASLRGRPLRTPLFRDVIVVGSCAPIGRLALERALPLLSPETYETVPWEDGIIEVVLVRTALLRRWPEPALRRCIDQRVRPRMEPYDLLDLEVDIEVSFQD